MTLEKQLADVMQERDALLRFRSNGSFSLQSNAKRSKGSNMNIIEQLKKHATDLKLTELACAMELGSSDVYAIIAEMEKQEPVAYVRMIDGEIAWHDEDAFTKSRIDTSFKNESIEALFTNPQPAKKAVMLTEDAAMLARRLILQVRRIAEDESPALTLANDLMRSLIALSLTGTPLREPIENNIEVQE